jgi:hypothetical protein
VLLHAGVLAEPRTAPAASNEPIAFDLPAQDLAPAIEAYSFASGWQVIYDASLATGRRSASVKGEFVPAVALSILLSGTGLKPQYMAADGIMLVPDPATLAHIAPLNPQSHFRDYYGRVQAALKRSFCADEQVRLGQYRIAIGFWIGSSGMVMRATPLGTTGRTDVDAAFVGAVRRLSVGEAPPAGFEQPVVILVTPDLLGQCNAAGRLPVRAAR